MSYLGHLLFGIFPYIALTLWAVGSLARYETAQYGWRSGSSQILRPRLLGWGSNLFHVGVLLLFFGHFAGLLVPQLWLGLFDASDRFHAIFAAMTGGIAGAACLAGLLLLAWRRLADPRIHRTSAWSDIVVLMVLLATVSSGLVTIWFSMRDPGAHVEDLTGWAQRITTFRGGATEQLAGVSWVYGLHIVLGLIVFAIFPFTRLVHVWSAPIGYLFRNYQVVRSRRPVGPGGERRGGA